MATVLGAGQLARDRQNSQDKTVKVSQDKTGKVSQDKTGKVSQDKTGKMTPDKMMGRDS